MEKFWEHFKQMDWAMILSAVFLVSLGLVSIYSASFFRGDFLNFKKQILFLGIGLLLMFALSFFDWRILRDKPYFVLILYFLSVCSLVFLFFFAPITKGVKAWYKIGPFTLDPIEITKIILIITKN